MIRAARKRLGLSQPDMASRTGLSPEAIRGYEIGRRKPKRDHLIALLEALEIARADANMILRGAGFAPITTSNVPVDGDTWRAVDELDATVGRCPWPVFAVNDRIVVVSANAAFQALVGADFTSELSQPEDRSLLLAASQPRFADHILNWDEAVGTLIAVWKYNFYHAAALDHPSSEYFQQLLARFAQGDPRYVMRFTRLWDDVAPLPVVQRWEYPMIWEDTEFGALRLLGLVSVSDDAETLFSFNDWIPIDAASWTALEQIKARAQG